ncbi:HAD-like domain-containing protein [Multifurca ochricompacta]|uniref:HAD-like domain-containing protein n=1 Tax=Multifurca ochricompacta TaxID=376703 RepID=A0AAD4LXE2_9AGAM|nr:HAD-like domain-containing protein [Multifurca ochricompacta]
MPSARWMRPDLIIRPTTDELAAAGHLLSQLPNVPLTVNEYIALRRPAQDRHWAHMRALPGAERLVAHLAAHGIPLAIATGSTRLNYARKTAHLQHVFQHFRGNIVCMDDDNGAHRGKPFPDLFLAAARGLGRNVGVEEGKGEGGKDGSGAGSLMEVECAERARGLVFEDSVTGVQAGKRAGMSVVWIPDERFFGVSGGAEAEQQPDQILRSLEEFVPEEWGLPPFDYSVAKIQSCVEK